MKRVFALILSVLTLVGTAAFASCSDGDAPSDVKYVYKDFSIDVRSSYGDDFDRTMAEQIKQELGEQYNGTFLVVNGTKVTMGQQGDEESKTIACSRDGDKLIPAEEDPELAGAFAGMGEGSASEMYFLFGDNTAQFVIKINMSVAGIVADMSVKLNFEKA